MSKDKEFLRNYRKLTEYYDKESKRYDKVRFESPGGKYVDDFEKSVVLKFLTGDSGLEIGIGTGRYGIYIGRKLHDFSGIDLSRKMLKIAKKKAVQKKSYTNLLVAQAENLPFINDHFQCIICIHTIQYILKPLKTLEEAYRVLKPRGRIIITSETDYFYRRFPFLGDWLQRKTKIKYFSSKELKLLLRKLGFKIIFEKSLFCLGSIGFYRKLPAVLIKLISKFDQGIKKGSILILVGEK